MNDHKIGFDISIIKYLLIGILLISACTLGLIIYATLENMDSPAMPEALSQSSREFDKAKDLANNENWAALLEHADNWISKEPKDAYANWFRAHALYKLERFADAAKAFEQTRYIAPIWSDKIDPYIAICKERAVSN